MNDKTRDLMSLATEAFARHQLIRRRPDRWRIARVEDGRILGPYATEVVSLWGGELYVGGDIGFCVFGHYSDSPDPIMKLRWIGECEDLDWYVLQKARIGLEDPAGRLTTEGRGRNKVPNARVVYAWAALRKLCQLIDQQDAERRTRIEPGFVGREGKAWHPWPDSREVDVEVPEDARMMCLVDQCHAMRIPSDVGTVGPLLYVPGDDGAYALDAAVANGYAKIKGEEK